MYFKKLELVGFKSFADKTTLHFEPGITAVVGPNGCGKSNVFDSIRWVLGEQSIKELRGSQSQDVIFNGSDSKEALGMAEVTLTFDNSSRYFPVEHPEVALTRRLFRSGESEYLLNKTQVRLKDIIELLAGTGIGAESYSLVQQGKIDLVLSARPEDRRLVFDEASGITKYKAQKKEALRRLEETDQNLLRVNDIIIEVKRQIGSLERQANKARKYKEIFEELKNKELNCALLQKNALSIAKDALIAQLRALELKESEFLGEIKIKEESLSSRQNKLKELEIEIGAVRNEVLSLENAVSHNKQHAAFNRERIVELAERSQQLQAQAQEIKVRLITDEEKLSVLRQEYNGIRSQIEEKSAHLGANETLLADITNRIKTSLEAIAATKRAILELVSNITHAKNDIQDLLAKQQVQNARKKRLEIEQFKIREEKSSTEAALASVESTLKEIEDAFNGLSSKSVDIKNQLESENISLGTIDNDIESLEKESVSLQSQKQFLDKLKNEYEGIGETLDAVIYLDKLPAEKLSGLVVKIKEYPEMLEASDPNSPASIKIKIDGEAKPIDLDTSKITVRIEEVQHKIDSLKIIKNLKVDHIGSLNKEIIDVNQAVRAQENVLIDKKATHKNITEQYNKMKEEEDVILLELSEIDSELLTLGQKTGLLSAELSQKELGLKENEERITSEQNTITLNNASKEDIAVAIAQTKTEIDALTKRITSDEATLKILEEAYARNKQNIFDLETQARESLTKQNALEAEISTIEESIVSATTQIQAKTGTLKEKEFHFDSLMQETSSVLKTIESAKQDIEKIKAGLYELQMQNKDVDFKYLGLKERIIQRYKIDIESVLDQPQALDEALLNDEINRLKDKLDSYGTVNLVAIEEYDELKARYDFLTQQQTDLASAKDSLHNAILKINRTTKVMFLETFEKIKVEFRNYFRMLFNGGDAQVFLSDEHDPLESGIEIICRPPGKKLQNVLLLSGGEKSLSATALIFAIFKIKPAPFCVLDEIDAALDEANVDRFGKMLHEFAQTSQFIVITHNKRTIANARVMYGITMQESGVSRIVSVKFADKKVQQDRNIQPVPAVNA